ncbi:MAG: ABC transporter permease [Candidatus Rokubacteria bacterium]|nr:ABC transporter permease [Candidatus Rokubacteria bacterium]
MIDRRAAGRARRDLRGIVGSCLLLLVIGAAIAGPPFAPSPDHQDLLGRLQPPGWRDGTGTLHLLGTDELGRDVLARLLGGSRNSLMIGVLSVLVAGAIGTTLGIAAGLYRGWVGGVIMRVVDVQMSFPPLVMAIAVVAVLTPGLGTVIFTLGIVGWVIYTRVARAEVLKLRELDFVQAARAIGATELHVVIRYILPNVLVPVLVVASFAAAQMIITESSLSFLGLGLPVGTPTWGGMISESRNRLSQAWWLVAVPGGTLLVTLLALNFLGDWLRDVLDPTLQV